MAKPGVAYLADGKLMLVLPGQQPRSVESQFVEGIVERRAEHRRRHGWRSSGMAWNVTQPDMPDVSGGELGMPADSNPARFLSVVDGEKPGEIYYTIETDAVGGVFHFDVNENYERRLAHKQDMRLADLARHPTEGQLACTIRHPDGSSSLGVLRCDGGGLREVTGGDSLDESPAWVPGQATKLVYQSAGIGRDDHGVIYGLAPYGIYELDLENDRMTTLLELEEQDCLSPHIGSDGVLYYIRRPYELRPASSVWHVVKDVVLFPIRLTWAFVHFLNTFSMIFSKKPLMTAGGPKRKGPDKRSLMLWGRWVQVDREQRSGGNTDKPLVPRTWELIRRSPNGDETAIASGVVAFDLCADGGIVYTNGVSVFHVDAGSDAGPGERLARGMFIERVSGLRL